MEENQQVEVVAAHGLEREESPSKRKLEESAMPSPAKKQLKVDDDGSKGDVLKEEATSVEVSKTETDKEDNEKENGEPKAEPIEDEEPVDAEGGKPESADTVAAVEEPKVDADSDSTAKVVIESKPASAPIESEVDVTA